MLEWLLLLDEMIIKIQQKNDRRNRGLFFFLLIVVKDKLWEEHIFCMSSLEKQS